MLHMSYSLNSLKEIIVGTVIWVIKGDPSGFRLSCAISPGSCAATLALLADPPFNSQFAG